MVLPNSQPILAGLPHPFLGPEGGHLKMEKSAFTPLVFPSVR